MAFSVLLSACKKKDDAGSSDGGSGGAPGLDGGTGSGGRAGGGGTSASGFAVGVEYMAKGLAKPYGDIGVTWAKTRLEAFEWGKIEPTAPVNGVHNYDWSCTDALIAEYQAAGMVNIQSYLTPKSSWGSRSVALFTQDPMPKPERMPDYRAWIAAMFERYDGDGNADMPALLAPVRNWVVGGEWTGFWGAGNEDDYIQLAEATSEAGRAAFPDVKLGTIPFMMWDVFQGNEPTDAQIATRLTDPPPAWRKSTAGMMKILDRRDLFDEISVHSLGDYTELPPLMRWMKTEMSRRGYDKPVFIDDAFPIGFLVTGHAALPIAFWPPVYPVTAVDERAVYDQLVAVAMKQPGAYEAAKAWIEGEVAKGLIKKIVTARGEGFAGIQMGNTEDWMEDAAPAARKGKVDLFGAAGMMGLVEVTHVAGPTFFEPCTSRTPGAPRPAHFALQLLIEKLGPALDGTVTVGFPVPIPDPVNDKSRIFRFVRPDGKIVVVAWNEPGHIVLPGQADPPFTTHSFVSGRVRVTKVATALPVDPASLVQEIDLDSAAGHIEVTTTPIFIEPLP